MTRDDAELNEHEQAEDAYAAAAPADLPPIDFGILVVSLNHWALIQLGEAAGGDDPVTTGATGATTDAPASAGGAAPATELGRRVDLSMARQTIDMLAILEEKTRGNLSGHEERLLSQVLFDLRIRYVKKAGS